MRAVGRLLIPLAALVVLAGAILEVRRVLLPFVLAATTAYLVHPIIRFFEVRGLRYRPTVITVYAIFLALYFGGIYLLGVLVTQEASHVATDIPIYVQRIRTALTLDHRLENRFPMLTNAKVDAWVHEHSERPPELGLAELMTVTPALAGHLLPFIELSLLVPFLTLFFMLDGPSLKDALLRVIPSSSVETVLHMLVQMDNSLGNYVRGMILQSVCMGIAAGICYGAMGLHYYVQIALWVALTSTIPLVGPISAAVAGGVVALFQWGTLGGLLKVLAVYMGIRLWDDWFLQPVIIRRAVHLHPALTVFSLMAGTEVAGVWGLFFPVPVVCIIKVVGGVIWEWYRSEYGLPVPTVKSLNVPLL